MQFLFRLIPYLFLFIITVFVVVIFILGCVWAVLTGLRLLGIGLGHEIGTFSEWLRECFEWFISLFPKRKKKKTRKSKPLTDDEE